MFAIASIYFLVGLISFIKDSEKPEAREKGKQHIIWGLTGMTVMVSVFFIMRIILNTLGIDENQINITEIQVNLPDIE